MQKQYFEDDINEFQYQSVSDGIKITAYSGVKEAVKLPSFIDKNPVVEIGPLFHNFYNTPFSVLIPPTVKRLDLFKRNSDSFFNHSENQITLYELDDGNPYFRYENGFLIQDEKLVLCTDFSSKKIVIPDGIVSVGSFAFRDCKQVSEIVFPESLKEIESNAFFGCSLKNVTLPSELESIGYLAFPILYPKLKISFPASVKNFSPVNGIIPLGLENNENFTICDNFLLTSDKKTLLDYIGTPIKELILPDYVETIAPDACNADFEDLKKLTLGASLKKICKRAFSDTKITSLKITPALEEIEEDAFDFSNFSSVSIDKKNRSFFTDKNALYKILDGGKMELITCFRKKIEEYTVAENTVTIRDGAFDNCSLLKKLILPDSLTEFSEEILEVAPEKIIIPKSVENIIFSKKFDSLQYEIEAENPFYVSEKNVIYKKTENGLVAVRFNGNEKEISLLPGTVSVAPYAFVGKCQKIVFPESVKHIERHAFANVKLKQIVLNESLLRIEKFAFQKNAIQTVDLPRSLQYISPTAFARCPLVKYTIPKDNENYSVYDDALFNKDGMVLFDVPEQKEADEFSVPAQTTEIGRAFQRCENIKAIRLPKGIKNIWKSALSDCPSLQDIYFEKSPDYINMFAIDHHLSVNLHTEPDSSVTKMMDQLTEYHREPTTFRLISSDFSIVHDDFLLRPNPSGLTLIKYISEEENPIIPSEISGQKITAIGNFAFCNSEIESAELPDTIESIGKGAFIHCYNLKSIVLPKKLKVLSASLFQHCESLEELHIPDGVERVEDSVFFGCGSLNKLTFPKSISYISEWIFADELSDDEDDDEDNKNRYKDLYLDTQKTIFTVSKDSYAEKFLRAYTSAEGEKLMVIYDNISTETKEKTEFLRYLDYSTQEDGTLSVKFRYLYGETPESAPSHIHFPQTIKGMPVTHLDISGIYSCVESIEIPASVVSLKLFSDFFFGCTKVSLKEVKVAEENPVYCSDGQALYTKDGSALLRFFDDQTETYRVRENTKIIEKYAFLARAKLKKLILPQGLSEIKGSAFHSELAEIEGIESVPLVANSAIKGTAYYENNPVIFTGTTLQKYANISQTRYEIPEGIERIEEHSFDECLSLESLYIPSSVNFISPDAFPFYQKTRDNQIISPKLAFFEVNPNNESFQSIDGILYSKDGKTLIQAPPNYASSVFEAPAGLEEIENQAFQGIQALKKVTLHSGITRIGKHAFDGCASLETLHLNAQEIGNYAFYECIQLRKVSFEQTKTIGNDAFYGCQKLSNIVLPDGLLQIGEQAFQNCALTEVTVPKTVLKTERESFSGCPRITIYDTIDPEAKPCEEYCDDCNGSPNSTVGFIGIGPAWAMWECAANHRWIDHEIIVRSAETDEIKYKVPMVSDPTQRMYYCTLTSSWGKNATFNFAAMDHIFPKIKGVPIKLNVALTRIRYPVNLSESQKKIYENYLVRSAKDLVAHCIDSDDMESLVLCEPFGILKKNNIDASIEYATKAGAVSFSAYLMNYKNERFGFTEPKLPSLSLKEPELWSLSKSAEGKIGRYKGLETEITFPSEWKGKTVTGVADTTSKVPENYLAITSVILPEGYTSIGDYAFYGCVNLEKITLPSTLQTIGKYAFHGCKKLKEIIMPDSLTTLGNEAFSNCSALQNVRFSKNLSTIPEYAFYSCNQLAEVDLPESVGWIEKGCFESYGLKKLTVRCNHLHSIGQCFGSKPTVYVTHQNAVADVYGIAKRSVHLLGGEEAHKQEIPSRLNNGLWEFSSVDSITFQDKIFVLTGFGADEEATITEKIQSLGGVVKSSTVVKTDYLIVMEEYNRITTKYQKAQELKQKGKNLAIISSSAFYAFVKNT